MRKSTTAVKPKRPAPESQSERFKEAARELEADEDEARWEERLKKVAKQKRDKDS